MLGFFFFIIFVIIMTFIYHLQSHPLETLGFVLVLLVCIIGFILFAMYGAYIFGAVCVIAVILGIKQNGLWGTRK